MADLTAGAPEMGKGRRLADGLSLIGSLVARRRDGGARPEALPDTLLKDVGLEPRHQRRSWVEYW